MRVLVTGASGFIGRFVVEAASRRGHPVVKTSRTPLPGIVPADVTDPSSLEKLSSGGPFDAVIHCAAIAHRSEGVPDEEFQRVNVEGTRNLVRFAGSIGVKRFVHLSSIRVYGWHGVGIRETDECNPRDAYGASKLASEAAAMEASQEAELLLTVLRPAPVVGEGSKGNLAKLIKAVDRGYFVNVGNGRGRKSMVYAGDVADACIRVIEEKQTFNAETYNLAGEPVTTSDLLKSVYEALGKNDPLLSFPAAPMSLVLSGLARTTNLPSLRKADRLLETWISDDVYSSEKIKERLGFSANFPIAEAIRRTVQAYKTKIET